MNKRWIAVLLAALMLLFALQACAPVDQEDDGGNLNNPNESSQAGWRRTVLYYLSDEGYLVPVMKQLPWEEGIGKAALMQLVDTPQNREGLAKAGLNPVVPEGVTFELSISDDEVGTVNLKDLPEVTDAAAEQNLVTAVVNTLLEFPTISSVQVLVDGKKVEKLAHGTSVKGQLGRIALNVEDGDLSVFSGEPYAFTLYLPNRTGSLNIPITKYAESAPTFEMAVQAMITEGGGEGLASFPTGTELIDADIVDDIATVNFSSAFKDAMDTDGLTLALYDAIYLTACGFGSVSELRIQVDGKAYEIEAAAVSAPLFVNELEARTEHDG